ncbi:MAG: DUF2946 family protein [Gammaproteobacteria bacterium]|nr:DUF2946 family protein [Gammaproteobacteria bacterium]
MDDSVIRAMAKWPDVPAVYGWLSLSRRGDWLIRGEPVRHRPSRAFIGRNFSVDRRGCWFFQNGPQRVYVELEYTPWIVSLDGENNLVTHTGKFVCDLSGAWLDEDGSLLLLTGHGVALLDHRDLEPFSARLRHGTGEDDEALLERAVEQTRAGRPGDLFIEWGECSLPVGSIAREDVPARFGFNPSPQPD